ncbi:MAG: transposase [Pseudomonadota bacterium]
MKVLIPLKGVLERVPMYLRGSVHNEVRLQAGDAKGIENVAQYIIRNTFSLAKLSYIEKTGTVICRSKMSHGGNKRNFQTYSPLEFIAAITQHIPERLAQMVRYYGWYSNRMRGDRQRATSQEDPGSSRSIRGGKVKAGKGTTVSPNG